MERIQFWRFNNEGVRTLMHVAAHLGQSGLERALLDLIYVRVSQLNGCSQCVAAHIEDGIRHGLEHDLLEDVAAWRTSASFTERQRAALAWAEGVTEIAKTHAPDELYRETASHFRDAELVDLTLAVALMNAFARIAVAFRSGPPPLPALID